MDSRIQKLAHVLVDYSTEINAGDVVEIGGSTLAAPLLEALYVRVLERGAHPVLRVTLPGLQERFYRFANDDQLQFINPVADLVIRTFDARISVQAEANTKELSGIDPSRPALSQKAHTELFRVYLDRISKRELKWCGTLFPTDAHAQDAEMSLRDYEDFVYGACRVDDADPVAWWRSLSTRQARLVDWLNGRETVHIVAPDTDLTLQVGDRTFINCDGKENFPDGEIFTSPVENSAQGHVRFTYPACDGGYEVEDVRLWFEDGRVVKATAAKNEAYLLKMLDADEGARLLGEFAIGTNAGITRFTKNTLFDEKIAGTFHLALGMSLPEAGGQNQSCIHWDMVCDMRGGGTITVDDVLCYRDGEFVI
ncbi:MAG: aminopeptidase [Chloroflexi bacterium]|nr:aminopeptidase [Chloroflexota bacterium]MBU1747899.1 aminopeptidase [Chloroflexota bacterium]